MKQLLLVFLGGGLGSVLRYGIGKWLNQLENPIPYGTMLSNILGSFLIGIILEYASKNTYFSENHILLLAVGFCGGFTTFSAFAFENVTFIKNGDFSNFIFYSLSSLLIGIVAVFAGIYVAKML